MIFSKKNIDGAQKFEMLVSELTELFPTYTFGDSIKALMESNMESYGVDFENQIEGLQETIAGLKLQNEAHIQNAQSADETVNALTEKFAKELEEHKAKLEAEFEDKVNKLSIQKLASSGYTEPVKVPFEAEAVSNLSPEERLKKHPWISRK